MTSQLTEDNLAIYYDSGCWGPRASEQPSSFTVQTTDLAELAATEEGQAQLQQLTPQALNFSIHKRGLEECADIMPFLGKDQFVRLFDYNTWSRGNLASHEAFRWLDVCHTASPQEMYKRFRQLDEEYQIAILSPFVVLVDKEEFEALSDPEQDVFLPFPGHEYYYHLKTDSEQIIHGFQKLFDASIAEDMAYAFSLLAHAAFYPPNEAEQQLKQFRQARLEEDGFLSYEESLQYFMPVDPKSYKERYAASTQVPSQGNSELFSQALAFVENPEVIQQSVLSIANALISLTHMELNEQRTLNLLLLQCKALLNLGLDELSNGNVEVAGKILNDLHMKELFGIGVWLVKDRQTQVLNTLLESFSNLPKRFETFLTLQKYGRLISGFDKHLDKNLDFLSKEVVKGFFNRYPLRPETFNDTENSERIQFVVMSTVHELNQTTHALQSMLTQVAKKQQGDLDA